jgi:hypothetical protein
MTGIDKYTVSYLNFNKDLNDITGKIWTPNGKANISSSNFKFGNGSLYLGGQCITTPTCNDFNFGTGDFTIDFWFYFTNIGSYFSTILCKSDSASYAPFRYELNNNATFVIYMSSSGSGWEYNIESPTSLNNNRWYHFAQSRKDGIVYSFINGKLFNTKSFPNSLYCNSNNVCIGRLGDYVSAGVSYFYGYIDEVRFSKGIARWTSDFDLATSEYTKPVYYMFKTANNVCYAMK